MSVFVREAIQRKSNRTGTLMTFLGLPEHNTVATLARAIGTTAIWFFPIRAG
jgi:hypothetical protein